MFLTVRPANSPPSTLPIPDTTITKGTPLTANLAAYFVDADKDPLTFYIEGLPLGTGIILDRQNGMLAGIPTDADLQQGVLLITVVADDEHGGAARNMFKINVIEPNNVPIVSLATNGVATEGLPFYKDLSLAFADPDGDKLLYQINGLSLGSGLSINPATGVMQGVPSQSDVNLAGPWPIRVQVVDGRGAFAQAQFFLTVLPVNKPPQSVDIPPMQGTVGQPFSFDARSFFFDAGGNALLTFSLRGLPPGTGLRFTNGVLDGAPSISDFLASPMGLSITVKDQQVCSLILNVCCLRPSMMPPAVFCPLSFRCLLSAIGFLLSAALIYKW
jgi:hypothetical protein